MVPHIIVRMLSLVLIVTLTLTTAAGAQTSIVAPSSDYWFRYADKLPIGSTVQIRTNDGKRFTAILAVVDQNGIVVDPKTRVPEPPRRISFDQLQQLQLKQNGSSAAKAAAIGVATGAATFFGIFLISIAAYSD
jgi:hypothetical protein